jgi:hypothetical protein
VREAATLRDFAQEACPEDGQVMLCLFDQLGAGWAGGQRARWKKVTCSSWAA